jgi:hypothetical protein
MKKKIQGILEVLSMILLTALLVQTCNLRKDIREYKNQVLKSK